MLHSCNGERVEIEGGVGPLNDDARDFFEKVVIPLVIFEDDEIEGIGTATLISPSGVLLLAKHVVEHAEERGVPLYALIRTGEPHDDDPSLEIGGLLPLVDTSVADDQDVVPLGHTGSRFTREIVPHPPTRQPNGARLHKFTRLVAFAVPNVPVACLRW